MSVKRYKPNTGARRISSVDAFDDVTKEEPEKALLVTKKRKAGRTKGKITVRHRGGGAKRRIRIVDFKRDKFDIPAKVAAIEYDPNRGARLALLYYVDGEKRYMIAPQDVEVGDTVVSSKEKGDIEVGNRFQLQHLPIGIDVYNVELEPGNGGQMARGAGTDVRLMAIDGPHATLKLPSGEVRMVKKECMATIGSTSNPDHRLIRWGKAGRTRHRGFRPSVRGKSMNPVDHPHGGGEGGTSVGMKHPKTPTGKPAWGVKTRKRKDSDKLIIKRRRKGKFVGN